MNQKERERAFGPMNNAQDSGGSIVASKAAPPTRREFLSTAVAASSLAFSDWLGPAAGAPSAGMSEDLQTIREIKSQGGKLQGIITIKSGRRMVPRNRDEADIQSPIRYFEGKNSDGKVIWPLATAPGDPPLPGPTLRARVGDQVELTLLNQVDYEEFGWTAPEKAECDEHFSLEPGGTIQRVYPDMAGDAPVPGSLRHHCFHASSTANLHFHGTHVTPDGLGDNVLLQLRPSPRKVVSVDPRITEPKVTEAFVNDDFKSIFAKGPPAKWTDLPETWREKQKGLVKEYDESVPVELRLSRSNEERIERGLWPQYAVGAYPYCFKLTKYTEDAAGNADPYQMGQCPGTHWYHAHKHGSTATNVMNGMAGVFVIEGDYDDALEKIYPDLKDPQKDTQKVLIIQNFGEAPNLARGNFLANDPPWLRVNGQLQPTIKMRPGEVQLWRLVNGSIRAVTTLLGFTSNGVAPEIRQIAQDGVQFNDTNYVNQPFLRQRKSGTPSNTFAPGNRVDLLVRAPLQAGSYAFKVLDTTRDVEELLLTVSVSGPPKAMEFPTTGPTGNYPVQPKFLKDIKPDKIRIWRRLDFGWGPPNLELRSFDGDTSRAPKFTIDDRQFSGDRYDQTMTLGDFEEWTLTNSTARIAHPFHIHVNPFQVVEIYDPNSPDQIYKPDKDFIWQDVIAIPPAKRDPSNPNKVLIDPATGKARDPGYVKIRHPFVDFPGSYVLHCHMLAHEDRGMMQLIRVIRSDQAIPTHVDKVTVPHH